MSNAVVIGGSLAGLCSARVLAEHFDRVTVYERDELPDGPDQRSAVPQGRDVHLLMSRELQRLLGTGEDLSMGSGKRWRATLSRCGT